MPEMTYGEATLLQAQNRRIAELEAEIERWEDDFNSLFKLAQKKDLEIGRLKKLLAQTENRLGKVPCRDNRCVEMAEAKAKIERLKHNWEVEHGRNARLVLENERLEKSLAQRLEQIRQHNENCEADCNYRRADATVGKYCEAHTSRGRYCPDCPRQYVID